MRWIKCKNGNWMLLKNESPVALFRVKYKSPTDVLCYSPKEMFP